MLQESLEFHLKSKLGHHHVVFDHLLGNFLQSVYASSFYVICLIDSAEFTTTQFSFQNEILDADCFFMTG